MQCFLNCLEHSLHEAGQPLRREPAAVKLRKTRNKMIFVVIGMSIFFVKLSFI